MPIGYKQKSISWMLRVAAVFLLFFVCGGVLSYFIFHRPQVDDNTYSEIKAPLGGKSEVTLPDGSHVWLNAGSKIRYQNQFNKGNRNIVLEGEAYFKVAKNKHIPFIVKTGDLNIVAVGTEFNVKAYNDEGIIETTLVEGAVTIHNNHQLKNKPLQQVFLEPKQKAVYVRDQQALRVEDMNTIKKSNPEIVKPEKGLVYVAVRIDPIPIIAWKDNKLIFKGEEMSNLAVKLDRKYNVSISFDTENIKRYRFSGTLEDETLTQVLDVIKLTAPIDYELNGKEVKIFENTQMTQKFSNHLKKK
jgi:ferric-dicitrate binding protein FerR (iron transport regulator)